jgi:hypothetical protein
MVEEEKRNLAEGALRCIGMTGKIGCVEMRASASGYTMRASCIRLPWPRLPTVDQMLPTAEHKPPTAEQAANS